MSESQNRHSSNAETSSWKPAMGSATDGNSKQSLIGPTVVIKGEVIAEENLLVMGRIEGFIDHSQTVTIHADGHVAAEVKAQEVLVEGTVDGNVYGTKRVQIAQSGKINGNVYAPRVGVLEGASFKGAIDMEPDVATIERRFRESTGTEAPKHDSKTAAQDSAGAKLDSAPVQADGKAETDEQLSGSAVTNPTASKTNSKSSH